MNMDRWKSRGGKNQGREEKRREEKKTEDQRREEDRRLEKRKDQKKEDAGARKGRKVVSTLFFQFWKQKRNCLEKDDPSN